VGFNDYGTTPNVWRPSDVPYPNTGDDTGVGQQPNGSGLGQEVTTTTTNESNSPIMPGWNLLADMRTNGTASITNVTVGTVTIPLNFGILHWVVFLKFFTGVGSPTATWTPRFSVQWPGGQTFIPEILMPDHTVSSPAFFTRDMAMVRMDFGGQLNTPGKPFVGVNNVLWSYSTSTQGTPRNAGGSLNPSQTTALSNEQWNGNGLGIDDIYPFSGTVTLSLVMRMTLSGTAGGGPTILGNSFTSGYPAPGTVEEYLPRWLIFGM
jgi:hypothetical protein